MPKESIGLAEVTFDSYKRTNFDKCKMVLAKLTSS